MKLKDYLKVEASAVTGCPVRSLCPAGQLCATHNDSGESALYPVVVEVRTGELIWIDLHFEQRCMFIRSGVFASISNLGGAEMPSALFGAGQALGLSELYVSRDVASSYYLRALTDATICSTPAKAMRKRLESLPDPQALSIVSCALTNISAATYTRVRTLAQPLIHERLLFLFLTMDELLARERRPFDCIGLTHDELAPLVGSDRASVTRSLHRLEDEGIIKLGYRRIDLLDGWRARAQAVAIPATRFHQPNAGGRARES